MDKKKSSRGVTVLGVIIAFVVFGFSGGSLRNAQWNAIVNEQRADDYGRITLCIGMKYSEYINAPKNVKKLEKRIKEKDYKNKYELSDLESDLDLAKTFAKNSDGILGRAKSCIRRAEEYEKENNIEISQKNKELREKIKATKYKDDSLN